MAHTQPCGDLEVLCATCPSAEEVTSLLQAVGFELIFHMDAIASGCAEVPPLPAQYHFRDRRGSEVIFLAGSDADPDAGSIPARMQERHAGWPKCWLSSGLSPGEWSHRPARMLPSQQCVPTVERRFLWEQK